MEPNAKGSSLPKTLTMGMEDPVSREVFLLHLAPNSKDHPAESTSSAYRIASNGDSKHDASFVSTPKRKWLATFDLKEKTCQEKSDVVLALGRCSGRRSIARDGFAVAVGSSPLDNTFGFSPGGGRGRVESDVFPLAMISPELPPAAETHPPPLHTEDFTKLQESLSEPDLLSCLGNRGLDSDNRESCNFSGPSLKAMQDGHIELPLDLGLGLAPTECLPDYTHSPHSQAMQIPIVDEGSSSARWMKSGGIMPHLLKSNQQVQKVGVFECSESNWMLADHQPCSGTTSLTEASASRDRAFNNCKFGGCAKGARGTSRLCIAHGGGRRCQKHGCNKGAEGRTVYCKAHGGGRRCETLGCTKSAEGKTDYCIGHGGGRRCSQEGCVKAARGRSGLCIRHGGGKRCKKDGCTKSAEGYTGLCISHGGGRRCQFSGGCTKGAQGSTKFCKAHGGGKRCVIFGCDKGAEGSTPLCKGHGGGKRCMFEGGGRCTKSVHGGTAFCVAHGGGKRCSVPNCSKSARGRTDFCVRHGGGKRCKFQGCDKSAQGSTDFCKAHGGGKRCTWGQGEPRYGLRSSNEENGELLATVCDRFARGRLGLCAAHSALVQRINGLDHAGEGSESEGLECSKGQELSNEIPTRSIDMTKSSVSTLMNEESWLTRVGDAPEHHTVVIGRKFGHAHKISDRRSLEVFTTALGPGLYLPGLGSSSRFTFKHPAPASRVISQPGSSSDPLASSVMLVQSFPPAVVYPQALYLQSSKHAARSSSSLILGQTTVSSPLNELDNPGSRSASLPEGSVHGGGFLSFLTSQAAKKGSQAAKEVKS